MDTQPRLTIEDCKVRQGLLRQALDKLGADRALLCSRENVQWLTGFRGSPMLDVAAILDVGGECTLFAPNSEPDYHAADRVVPFEAQWLFTMRQDQVAAIAGKMETLPGRTAVEFSCCGPHYLAKVSGDPLDVEGELLRLRRYKHPDEIGMIRRATACTAAMYGRARQIIRPGITELEVFNELQAVAVDVAGEPLTHLGNDYRSNEPGGPPRNRPAGAGELMILDLGPAYRGYHADNCRTFSVDRNPTDEQLAAQGTIANVFEMITAKVKPGVMCQEIFARAKAILDEYEEGSFFHHLGHGIGLFPHEAPHLNPSWDDVFEVGDVFTVEPGLYNVKLRAGIRIEENYLVTATGVEQLTTTPIDL
jgi:Xaa-Pro dipeptidase